MKKTMAIILAAAMLFIPLTAIAAEDDPDLENPGFEDPALEDEDPGDEEVNNEEEKDEENDDEENEGEEPGDIISMTNIILEDFSGLLSLQEEAPIPVSAAYQLIGRVFEQGPPEHGVPGEQIIAARIDTGLVNIDPALITTDSFEIVKGASRWAPMSVSVEGSVINLIFNDGFSYDGIAATSGGGNSVLDINNINLVVKDGAEGYAITLAPMAQKYYNPWVDGFTYTSPTFSERFLLFMTYSISYNMFAPDNGGAKAPLIIWYPSASEVGSTRETRANYPVGNLIQPEIQAVFGANGAHVMTINIHTDAIQTLLAGDAAMKALVSAINHAKANFNIDENRVYIMGGSWGGGNSIAAVHYAPNIFAAAIPAAPMNSFDTLANAKKAADAGIPVWLLHSANDPLGTNAPGNSIDAYRQMQDAGGTSYVTIFDGVWLDGEKADHHISWIYILRNFTGAEPEVLDSGTVRGGAGYGGDSVDKPFVSTRPTDLGYANILSWLAAQTKLKTDKAALRALYEANIVKVQGTYSDKSWAAFGSALTNAASVLGNPHAPQSEIDAAYNTLLGAAADLVTVTASAEAIKVTGNKNDLIVTVTETYADGRVVEFTEAFVIANNIIDVYVVGEYSVYVDTKGNDWIRNCWIVND